MGYVSRPIEERFWEKVDTSGECWIWLSNIDTRGYGRFKLSSGHSVRAHRWAYIQHRGSIPEDLTLDHLCRVRRCVKPTHLEPVTMRENILRGQSFSAQNAAKTHCPQGHPYDLFNTRWHSKTKRDCRACKNTQARARRHQHKE